MCAPAGFTASERSELAMRSSPSRRYVLAITPSCPRRLGGQFIRRWCNGFRPLRAASAVPAAPCTRCTIYRIYATTATLAQADELELELELEVSSRSGCCAARRSASVLASAGCSSACRESEERCVSAHDWLLQLAARCGRITAERRTHQRARAPQMGAPEARPARRAWADARMCSVLGRDERVQ